MNDRVRATTAFLAAMLVAATNWAADEPTVWKQTPEKAPSFAADAEAVAKPAIPESLHAAFEEGEKPKWIWGPEANEVYFVRKALPQGVKRAWMKATCDNRLTVWLNRAKVYEGSEWQRADLVDLTPSLDPSENVLIAKIENEGGISGFLAKVLIELESGEKTSLVSDDTWMVTKQRNSRERLPVTVHGELGRQPWGNSFASREVPGTPRDVFEVLPGFEVERLFTVPKEELGSWVAIAFDDRGRLIVSDQGDKGLFRITLPAPGSADETVVERIPVSLSSAQGMLWAFDSLYVSVNGGPGSGLYRVRDTNGDDTLDEVVKLHDFRGGGEHGPHALRLSPDGKSIYVICGNHTQPPFTVERNASPQTMGGAREVPLKATLPEGMTSRIPPNWDEDLLLTRQWDANGHAAGVLAPGGWIAKTDPEGKTWELISMGYRNPYDMDFNADGELFAYDADMEWDLGAPWYRPTRVVHAVSGSEFGWRSGTGKWPTWYPDSLPPAVDIGPGSPVGVAFGYGTKFPAKYQRALYICDWTFGTMYAIHFTPRGATYDAEKEEFLSRTPLPLTDVAVGLDGCLYFTVGGRGTQSELYRVTYQGDESTEKVTGSAGEFAELRALRRLLEEFHRLADDPKTAVATIWPNLGHEDRFIRYAARIAIENQPVEAWRDRVIAETNPEALINAAIALARQGEVSDQGALIEGLSRLEFRDLTEVQQLELLRAWQLVFIRLGQPDEATAQRLGQKLQEFYPASSDALNRELCQLLVFLNSTPVIEKTLVLLKQPTEATEEDIAALLARNPGYGGSIRAMLANRTEPQKVDYLFSLRNLKTGWTIEQRRAYFEALVEARQKSGGNSYRKFIENIDREAFENATEAERLAIEAMGARPAYRPPQLPQPVGPGRDWTVTEVLEAGGSGSTLAGRNFKNGEKMFQAARCVVCHRFAGDGGATGPDLTQSAGRFSLKDLCEAIIEPNKVISDQYKATVIETAAGQVITGRVVSETEESILVSTDQEDATKLAKIDKKDIDTRTLSDQSLMPKDLLKTLNRDEVLDLMAYVLSRGNPRDAMFR